MTSSVGLRRIVTPGAIGAWTLTLALLATVVAAGPIDAGPLVLDRLTAVLVVLITGVSGLTAIFSTRYLQDDPRLGRFLALLGLTTAGTVVFATAASLLVLVAGWLVAGAGFCLLLAHRRDVSGSREALRRTAVAFAAGDLALVGAAAIALVAVGNLDLRRTSEEAETLAAAGVATPVALLVVLAALARCAQLPLHRWLPATVAAPTPVSALLHAGLINAGGILLVRLGPVTGAVEVAAYVLFAAGAATALYGGAVMLARPDVKGALAHSTMAQMGFMLVQVALGAAAAAVVHLVGHAMYKAALFLGSGSAIAARRRKLAAPATPATSPAVRAACALGLPAAALLAAVWATGGVDAIGGSPALVLLAFAWAASAHAVDAWLRSGAPAAVAAAVVATAATAGAYVGLLAAAKAFLAPDLPAVTGVSPWAAAPVAVAVAVMTAVHVLAPAAATLRAGVYAWLVDAGSTPPSLGRRRLRRRSVPAPSLGLVRRPEVAS